MVFLHSNGLALLLMRNIILYSDIFRIALDFTPGSEDKLRAYSYVNHKFPAYYSVYLHDNTPAHTTVDNRK